MMRPTVGDEIVVTDEFDAVPLGTWHTRHTDAGARGTVTSVNTNSSTVRFTDRRGGYTVWVKHWNMELADIDPNRPTPRKLGTVPEGMIAPDDPRLDWLWDDAAKIAKQQNYCSQFELITMKLGIPPRPKKFTVSTTVGELTISAAFMAHTVDEAQAMLEAKLADSMSGGVA